ncbi:glycosyltransferase family 4 protein [Acinetobacter sichuanensis]|uniref:glycosyltransferase family 4 protein n=1 Tax=Acinetobacter sichuanensis TaxID=2136183 RepID=UPI00280F9FF0|nr:glycosyltransferase family 4 protein [Acinetobacter sichuanensis]MDQ9022751.1 glycosyltransferase family 4 protein [Acinetobacter sichuanensis]
MKFVLVSNNLTSVKNFRCDLLLDIQKKGYEVHILAPDFLNFIADKDFLENRGFILHEIKLSRTGTNPISDFTTLLNIYQILKSIQADIVLSYTIKPVIYGTIAAYLAKVPKKFALISGLGFAFQDHADAKKSGLVTQIINNLYKMALKKTTKVFFQNTDDQALLTKLGILTSNIPSVVVNGSGVNTEYYYHAPLNKKENGQFQINFLMVARLLKDKGIREYFEAAKIVKQQYPDVIFNLAGGLDENPTAISKDDLDIVVNAKVINYLGKLSDVRSAILESNIFVLPSYREGVPRSTLEAMSMGRSVITTNAPGCKETVVDNKNGFLVDVQSVDGLVSAMLKFVEHPELIDLMGLNSRNMAVNKYDVVKVNDHMITEMQL